MGTTLLGYLRYPYGYLRYKITYTFIHPYMYVYKRTTGAYEVPWAPQSACGAPRVPHMRLGIFYSG
ncbi:hypothetical protein B484DRAFT_455782 [Ochromonadaceae sp. CCMP2298]|nr:hypothetical protein B484DRAFT_455782 [Ochromonadaceae sp. CCMP2298]